MMSPATRKNPVNPDKIAVHDTAGTPRRASRHIQTEQDKRSKAENPEQSRHKFIQQTINYKL
jgi:hypothetical protein